LSLWEFVSLAMQHTGSNRGITMNGLAGKVALVTGGGSGIGEAVARRFAAQGAKVGITGRRAEPLEKVAADIGAMALPGDATDATDVDESIAKLVKRFGGLDIVVNNAGIVVIGNIEKIDDADWSAVVDTNLNGPRRVVRAALPHLRQRGGGTIVNISSIGAFFAGWDMAVYGPTKAALVALTMSLARDYGAEGIRVNALCPGWVDTPMVEPLLQMLSSQRGISLDAAREILVHHNPIRRMTKPDEIARCVEFLATDASSCVTGAVLLADGGQSVVDVGTLILSPP
jgi:NAD(P)-dependent dehydrogenase (short-subunit alcohol dehydrogenase family)